MGNMCGKIDPNNSLEKPLLDDDSLGGGISGPIQPFNGVRADTAAIQKEEIPQPSVSAARADTAAIQPSVSAAKADTAAIQPSVSAAHIITSDGSIRINKSGPIDPFIRNGKSVVCLRALYFENKKDKSESLYVVRHTHRGWVEYHVFKEKDFCKSTKLCNYAEFLNGEMSEVDFKQSLSQNFPEYHAMLWNILTDGRFSARLYK